MTNMGKIIETIINRFDGGMVNDPRDPRENVCRVVSNFDVFTNLHKMTPYYNSTSGDDAAQTSQKQNFCIGSTGSAAVLSLGVVSGTARAEVRYKNISVGATFDLDDDDWDLKNNNQSASGTALFDFFVYYKRTARVYGVKSNGDVWKIDPTGSASITEVDTNADLGT